MSAITSEAIRQLLDVWSRFDIANIDASWRSIAPGLVALIESRHRLAAERTVAYYQSFRLLEEVPGTASPVLARFDRARAAANLELLGPIYTKKSVAARRPKPVETAFVRVSGEMGRLIRLGERDTMTASLAADRQARGWRRITSAQPCDFCSMLASRGSAYRADTAVFQSHPHCACSAEPAY